MSQRQANTYTVKNNGSQGWKKRKSYVKLLGFKCWS